MPQPIALCLEDLDARSPGDRYLRCVALTGRQPGLRIDRAGAVRWCSDEAVACELWVSLDGKLILFRPEGAAPVTVQRAGRALDVPAGKPVVLLDQDEFAVGGRRTRVHVHGIAPAIHEPAPLPAAELHPAGGRRAAAAAVALGAALGAAGLASAGCSPAAPAQPQTPAPNATDAGAPAEQDAGAPEIEIRVRPPAVPWTPPPPPPPPPIEVRQNPPGAPANVPHAVPPGGDAPGGPASE